MSNAIPVSEESILKPRPPNLHNSDDWPAFSLGKVNITSQLNGEQISLLSAHKGNPVKVSGRLVEVEDEQLPLLRDSDYKTKVIELKDVTIFAYAEYDDGTYGFWAAGKAGWFEIESTALSYRSLYEEMAIAASMLYMFADKCRRANKNKSNLTNKEVNKHMKRIFSDYFAQGRDPARFADAEDVRDAFHDHRDFLITSMLEGQEGIDWNDTPMLNYFQLKFPDDVTRIKSRIFQTNLRDDSKPLEPLKKKPESVKVEEPQPLKKKKGRPRKDSMPQQPRTPVSKVIIDDVSSDEEPYGNPNVVTRKRKGILQPSGSKYSKKSRKAAGRQTRLPDLDETRDSDDEIEDRDERRTPSAEESPLITIKTGEHLQLITDRRTKHSHPDSNPPPAFLPSKYLELKLVEYDLLTMEPQGPGDLWTCPFEGCYQRVHQASTAMGKARITDHSKSHQHQAQEKIDLALNESRPYLPVNNLVRRLQAFAPPPEAEVDLESVGRKFVAPIRRKY